MDETLSLANKHFKWLNQLYMQAPVAIGVYIGKEHKIEFANPMMCQIWGRSFDQVIHKPLFLALPEVAGQGFEEILAEVFTTGKPFIGNELPATLSRNGNLELCYVNILYKPLLNEQEEIIGVVQTATEVTELVKAKLKAEQQEEILKVALESGKLGTWFVDLVQNTFTRSKEYDRIFGYKENLPEFSHEVFLRHVLEEDQPHALASYQQGIKGGNINYELRIRRVDNKIRWVQIKGATAYNLKNQPVSMSGVIMDITEQKQAIFRERQLAVERAARAESERQEQMLRNLFMDAPALICTLRGPEFVFDLVNPQYQKLFRDRELVGRPMLEAVPELKDQPIYTIIRDVYKTGKAHIGNEVPIEILQADSGTRSTHYFNFVYQAMRGADGSIIGLLVFAYDVTEQLVFRHQIERSETKLRMALEAGHMGTWHLDLENDYSYRSPQHDQIFGYTEAVAEWGYQTFLNHVVPEDQPYVKDQFDIAYKFGDLHVEARILGADQKQRWILVRGQVFYEDEKPSRIAGVVMDITERKIVEEKLKELTEELAANNKELQQANREIQSNMQELSQTNHQLQLINADLDNFIYTASHDLKAPISNIEGLMNMLVRQLSADDLQNPTIKKTLDMINASVERFKLTIRDLTDIARLQKEAVETSLVNISEILEEVKLDLEAEIKSTNTTLEVNLTACEYLQFSPKNLHSILHNLLSNAIKYRSPERSPCITISCTKNAGFALLRVTDNGLGMKEKDLKKIFSMFTRLHTHVEGSGVGLYLVKRIVDNAGGKLEVTSQEGKGSTFTVWLPVA